MTEPRGRPLRDVVWLLAGALLALPAAASIQALVSTYLHRYEVVAGPVTTGPSG